MTSAAAILRDLKALANPANVAGMAHFGMTATKRLGVSVPVMRQMAKAAGRDHAAALRLWKSGIPEARIVASMVADPASLTVAEMDAWVRDFDSWDVCDQACLNLFVRSPLAWGQVERWAASGDEFVRRAAFALIACLAVHDKAAADARFIAVLPLIEHTADDERNFVKKAVNWALRQIGKRNAPLNKAAIGVAKRLRQSESKAARWVAGDALRELQSEAVQASLARKKERARA